MIDVVRNYGGWLRGGAVAVLLAAVLAACGPTDPGEADQPAVDQAATEAAAFDEGASPEAIADPPEVDAPEQIDVISLTIEDGRLDPDRFEAVVDSSYVLEITGDGTERTLAIEGLVDDQTIAAEGQTEVGLTISGDLGDREITLDGESAGTLTVIEPGGIS